MIDDHAYRPTARYVVDTAGATYIVKDSRTGLTMSRHFSYLTALRHRNKLSTQASKHGYDIDGEPA